MPQIKRGNEPITIQRRKDLALLIYLFVTSQPQSRDTLATLLWQEEGQAVARSNLRKSLSRLKALLGENSLLISQDQISLHPDLSLHLDVNDFQEHLEQFRQHHPGRGGHEGQTLCPVCLRALDEAAILYQADFLNGFLLPDSSTFEEWQFFQAESLRQNLAEALEQLTRQYAADGDFPAAITYCRRWLAIDRLHEPAQRQLMLLYALNDQPAAAKRQFEECVRLLNEELGAQPEPETLQLFDAIQKKKLTDLPKERSLPGRTEGKKSSALREKKVYSLPTYPSPFVGREKELEEIQHLLQDPSCSLLTLLGPGGSGKTRLALQTAVVISQNTKELFPDGVCFISLAPLTDPEAIVGALISGLKISSQATRGINTRERLLGYLQGRRILLVLDNFEHLLGDESIGLISEILGVAQQSKLLITSRERLNLLGEHIFRVEGLAIPEERAPLSKMEADSLPSAFSALKLFEQSAVRVQPSFAIAPQNYETIVQICRIVQGMPLAIEMAACWLEIFSLEEIRDEITHSLDFLQSNLRDLPDRQRSLRAVFDSSWNLLDKQMRPVMKALSIFRAGFTREAAQSVTGASARTLLEMTNKSWLQRLSSGRYQIHELLRQFCFEKLQQEPVTFEQVKKRYCEYYESFGSRLWQAMKGRDQKSAFATAGEEFENFNTAWAWLVGNNQIGTAVEYLLPTLFYYAEIRDLTPELLQVANGSTLEIMKDLPETSERHRWEIILNTALNIPGRFAVYEVIGFGMQKDLLQSIWSLLEKEGPSYQADYWSIRLAYAYGLFVHDETAIRYLENVLLEMQDGNQSWERAMAQLYLAKLQLPQLSYSPEKIAALERHTLDAVAIFSAMDDELNVSYALLQLGSIKVKQEKLEEAIEQWGLATAALSNLDEWAAANVAIRLMGDAYLQMGQFEEAFNCFDRIARICYEQGHVQDAVGALSKESFEMVRYGDLEEARRIRQQCVDAIETIGPEYQVGWNDWEMGEILRVMGNFEEAARWYEKARKHFEAFPDKVWKIFYLRGFGDIALTGGDFVTGSRHFLQSLELAQETRHEWAAAYALWGLGRCELGLGQLPQAREHFLEGLRYAFETADKGISLVTLTGYAELLCREGELEMAARLGSLVNGHYATWNEIRTMVAGLLSYLQNIMTVSDFEQAQNYGQVMDLHTTVGDLIGWQKP
jgi:predicted ATPase/DNA-binding SARP family transcriptional activator/tetratricopeptide (TPR) repeat protein